MKKNFGMFGLPRWGVGAALLALFAIVPASRAALDVVVNNLSPSSGTSIVYGGYYGQVFTMDSSSGNLSTLILGLSSGSTGSANVYFYNASGTVPTGSGLLIGTVSGTGDQTISLTSHPNLAASTSYAIIIHDIVGGVDNVNWRYTASSASGGTGSLPVSYNYSGDGSSWGGTSSQYLQMEVAVVPEVPMTGLVMGIGALAIAAGHTLRRKIKAVSPANA